MAPTAYSRLTRFALWSLAAIVVTGTAVRLTGSGLGCSDWPAVTGSLDWPPVILFAVIFYWTPPHFWGLAIRHRADYRAAGIPMLPAVASLRATGLRILGYTLVLWALTIVFGPVAGMGAFYMTSAVVAGAVFTGLAVDVLRRPRPAVAMRLFGWSITYVVVLFGAMAADELIRGGINLSLS